MIIIEVVVIYFLNFISHLVEVGIEGAESLVVRGRKAVAVETTPSNKNPMHLPILHAKNPQSCIQFRQIKRMKLQE